MSDDKKSATRGTATFDAVRLAEEQLPEENVMVLSCAPAPAGSRTRFNPNLKAAPRLDPAFIQQSEITRLRTASKTPAETAEPSMATILADVASAMGFKTWDVDLGRIPAGWNAVVGCFDVTIASIVVGFRWEVTVKSSVDITSNGETFPAGDAIAIFRIWVPKYDYFVRHFRWNPACCNGTARTREDEVSDTWYPDAPPSLELPPNWGWDWKPKLKYKFDVPPKPEPDGDK